MGSKRLVSAAACATIVAGAGCGKKENAYVAPPPPEVTVANPQVRTVPDTVEFTGRTRGGLVVEVRARVKGFIDQRHVEGGQRVAKGDLLYTIDQRTFAAAVRQREAEVANAKANLELAKVTLSRVSEAVRGNAVSKQDVDKAAAERDMATAQVELAEANLTTAKLDLEFTEVRAPMDGRLGIDTLDVGQLVGANEATLLATLINDTIMYVDFTIDERQLIEMRRAQEGRRPGEDGRKELPIFLGTANDEGYPYEGRYNRSDNTVDPTTGTLKVEATFDNAKGELLPGLFVRVRATTNEREAVVAPDAAVLQDQGGRYVLAVNAENVVEKKYVRVGPVAERQRRIDDGLTAQDRIVVNGLQRARPGAKVDPKTAPPAAPASAPPPAAAPAAKPDPAKSAPAKS